jgi:hypothetical protein
MRFINVPTCLRPTSNPARIELGAQHARTDERVFQVQLVKAAHDRQIGGRHSGRLAIRHGAGQLQDLALLGDG